MGSYTIRGSYKGALKGSLMGVLLDELDRNGRIEYELFDRPLKYMGSTCPLSSVTVRDKATNSEANNALSFTSLPLLAFWLYLLCPIYNSHD